MTALTINKPLGNAETTLVKLDLDSGPHSFTFTNHRQMLCVENGEVGAVTVNILGDGVTIANCPGLAPINVSAGYDFVIAAGDEAKLYTSERQGYLGADKNSVVVTVTGATGSVFGWVEEY
jgi:hypothetical protein